MKSEALIIAQPSYAHWEPLPLAAQAARMLANDLGKQGYTVGRADLLDGVNKARAEQEIAEWCANVPEDAGVMLFWTGHGTTEGGHYLVCSNSPRSGLTPFNAVDSGALGPVIANCKADKILVVLDTCYSGHGASEIAATFAKVLAARVAVPGRERAIAVIASAQPIEKVQEGIFCNALRSALLEPGTPRSWSDEDECIHSEFLARALSKLLPADVSRPQYKADGIGQDFIPNPRYRPGRPAEVVEERAWRLASSSGAEHFDLAARGIEVGESGWYFAGRKPLLRTLIAWLRDSPHGVRIVTGPPGAGKSAVMGRLATLSDKQFRAAATNEGVRLAADEGTLPPEGIIDVAIHAKGKTLDECARALAQALALPIGKEVAVDVEALVAEVRRIDRRVTIMIDALDEAASVQGESIASRLIVPLGKLDRVRVLVGCRRSLDGTVVPQGEERHGRLRAAFGADVIIDDLEDQQDTRSDIAEYVRLRLATPSSKHRENPAGMAAAADRVAARAEGVFLYARIVSRTLQDLDRLDGELPDTALTAFAQDLRSRFGADQQRVDDLLAALAWGEGKGLSRRVWLQVANALAHRDRLYTDDDVTWVLGHAGWHIIEAGEDGQAVYRLGHQALADHYRGRHDLKDSQKRIVEALTAGVSGAGWLDRDRYLWRHLADHAAQADRLGALIREPGYLAVADPARLLSLLPAIEDEGSRRFVDVYDRVADRLVGQPPLERMALLHMTAQMEVPDLAPRFEPPVPTRWRCRWARVQPSMPHRIIGRHSGSVTSVACCVVDGRLVAVSGSRDKTVRLWDARSGAPIGEPLSGHTAEINAVAVGVVDGRGLVVSAGGDKTVRLWDMRNGAQIGQALRGHRSAVTAVALGTIDDCTVVASGSRDHTIRLWDVRSGEPIGEPWQTDAGTITALTVASVDCQALMVSGSSDRTVRLWDARSGAPIGHPLQGDSWINAVVLGVVDGRAVVASGSENGTVQMWDAHLATSAHKMWGRKDPARIWKRRQEQKGSISAIAVGAVDARAVVVTASNDHNIRLWDACNGSPIAQPLRAHIDSVTAVVWSTFDGRPVMISGSRDSTVRLWDVRRAIRTGTPLGDVAGVRAVALGKVKGRAVVVSGGDDQTVRLWDGYNGAPIQQPLQGHKGAVTAVTTRELDGRLIVVSGSDDNTVRRWNVTLESKWPYLQKILKWGLWTARIFRELPRQSKGVLFLAKDVLFLVFQILRTLLNPFGGIVALMLEKNQQVQPPLSYIGPLNVAALYAGPGLVVAASVSDGWIRLWDADSRSQFWEPLRGHSAAIGALPGDLAHVGKHGLVVVAGSKDSTIKLWRPETGAMIKRPLQGHAGPVIAVALGELDNRAVVASASDDFTVRLWDALGGHELFAVDLGTPAAGIAFNSDVGIVLGMSSGLAAIELKRWRGTL